MTSACALLVGRQQSKLSNHATWQYIDSNFVEPQAISDFRNRIAKGMLKRILDDSKSYGGMPLNAEIRGGALRQQCRRLLAAWPPQKKCKVHAR
jgi:hypothetical protein